MICRRYYDGMKGYSIILYVLIILFSVNATLHAQHARSIHGIVTDEKGEPLPGASVSQKRVTQAESIQTVICDVNGHFSLSIPTGTTQLEVSFIGFETKVITLTAETSYHIEMKSNESNLDEVVVTGMFTRKANTFTGAVSTVTKDDLLKVGNQNVIQSLKNIDPSFIQLDNLAMGSNPNSLPELQMRGQSSFPDLNNEYQSNPNQPLFILDGFETELSKIIDMDMNIIESMTLLKDATAKAIYGAKAANGVVVIETKRPAAGKMRITYNANLNIEAPDLSSYDLTNAAEKLEVERLAGLYYSDNVPEYITRQKRYSSIQSEILAGVDTDWLAQPVRTGVGQKHSLYLEGGDQYMVYGVDLSYNQVTGVMKGSDRNTFSGGVTLSYRVKNFMFRNKLSVTNNVAHDSPWGDFSTYAKMNPYNRIYDNDGELLKSYQYPVSDADPTKNGLLQTVYNPVWNSMINTKYVSEYTDITNNFQAEWNVLPTLKVVGRFGITYKKASEDSFKPASHTDFIDYTGDNIYRKGSYLKGSGTNTLTNGDLGVNYSIAMDKHALFLNGQANMSSISNDYWYMVAEGFSNDNMDHVIFGTQYQKDGKPSGSESLAHTLGGVASANYSYDERFLADLNYRLTGSSEFGSDSRWGSFWSVGAGWNLHNEAFLKNTFVNRLKLRASTGYTGSQGFNTYASMATVRYYTNSSYDGAIGSYLVAMANNNLKWQRKYDQNYGADFTLFNNRINGRFDYYTATTKGMLSPVTLPESTGFSTYTENVGESENKGFETYINVKVLENTRTKTFLNIYGSIAHNTNKLKKISEALRSYNDDQDAIKDKDDDSVYKGQQTKPSVRFIEGQSLNAIWAVKSLGIDPVNGKEIFVKSNGDITYEYSAADQVVCGDAQPKYNGNFGLNAGYKNINLNLALSYRWGGQIYNQTLVDKVENADIMYNVDRRVFTDRWQKEGDIARFKSISDRSYTRPTSRFVEDYSLLTLSSINLSYDFSNTQFLRNSFLQQLKVFVYLNDLFTVSSVEIERGTSYPYARNFSLAVQAAF